MYRLCQYRKNAQLTESLRQGTRKPVNYKPQLEHKNNYAISIGARRSKCVSVIIALYNKFCKMSTFAVVQCNLS